MAEEIETRSVEAAELKAGLKLKPGHLTVLVVDGMKGTPPPDGPAAPGGEQEDPGNGGGTAGDEPSEDPGPFSKKVKK